MVGILQGHGDDSIWVPFQSRSVAIRGTCHFMDFELCSPDMNTVQWVWQHPWESRIFRDVNKTIKKVRYLCCPGCHECLS